MSIKFGILGYGYVGKATHYSILKQQDCKIHDIIFNTSREDLKDSDYVFICIPTSTDNEVKVLIKEINLLKKQNSKVTIIVRSTLPINTCSEIELKLGEKIIYMPEFLRERFWKEDCLKRPLIVGHNGVELPQFLKKEKIIECTTVEAETLKMFSNNYAVVKIAYANLFYELSTKVGADYNTIKDAYLQIANDQTYIDIPGPDGSKGFGGKCLPKDLNFLIDTLSKEKINQTWLTEIRDLNKEWSKKF